MIAVAELLNKDRLPGNYFASEAYVQGDFELGLLENRHGNRLVALPDTLLQALYSSLEDEVGSAAGLVMFQCGHWWGKYFYRRFSEEVSTYYKKPLAEMEMVEFLQCLKQCWKTYGWGNLNLEFKHYSQGYIIATVENSAFAEVRKKDESTPEKPACYAEAGFLSIFFSQLTGQDLHCVQTTCESMGASENIFILGLEERLKVAEACVEEQQDHDTIMMRLGLDQTDVTEPALSESPETQITERQEASLKAGETSVAEQPASEKVSLASTAAPEMLVDSTEIDALASAEESSADITMPPVENGNIDRPEAVTEEGSVGCEETADMPEASFAAVELAPQETAGVEAPPLESSAALEMPTDLPDLDTLESTAEISPDMTMSPVEDINIDLPEAVTEEGSVECTENSEMLETSFSTVEPAGEDMAEATAIESAEALDMLTDLPDLDTLESTEEISPDMTMSPVEDVNIDMPEAVTEEGSVECTENSEMPETSFSTVEPATEDMAEATAIESTEALSMLTDLPDLDTLESMEEISPEITMPPVEDINIDISEAVTEDRAVGFDETAGMPETSFTAVETAAEEMAEAPALDSAEALNMLTDLPDLDTLESTEEISPEMTMSPVEDVNIDMPEAVTEEGSVECTENSEMPETSFAAVQLSTEDIEETEQPAIESAEALNMLTELPDLEALESTAEISPDMTMSPVEDINIDMPEASTEAGSLGLEETAEAETPALDSAEALNMLTDLPDLETLESTEEISSEITMPPMEDSNIDMPEASTEGISAIAESTAPEMMIDEPKADESTLSSDSLEALDNLVGLADLDGLNELENLGE